MGMKNFKLLFVVTMILIASVIACGQPTEASSTQVKANFEQVVAAAKQEGKVQIYGGFEPIQQKALLNLWNQQYPEIEVLVIDARAPEIDARIEAEQASRNYVCDISQGPMFTAWVRKAKGMFANYVKKDLLPNLSDPSAKWFTKPVVDAEETYVQGVWGALWGIVINTNLVPQDKQPKSWADLTDPYWSGKVYMGYPAGDSIGAKWFYHTMGDPKLGRAYHEKLAKQNFTIYTHGSSSALKACVAGEYALQFPAGSHAAAELPPEVPVKFIFPEEGTISQHNNLAIVKNAPHPNAALVFINFLLSKDAQTALALGGRYVARADASYPYPKFQAVSDVKVYDWPDEQEYVRTINSMYQEARAIYNIQ